MIDTSVAFTASPPSANPQSAEQHSANFDQMLTNSSSQAKEQTSAENANADIIQPENELLTINDVLTAETTVQINETLSPGDQQAFIPLTANQFIDQLPIQLAVVATQLRQEGSHSAQTDEASEQAIIEQLTNNSENSDAKLNLTPLATSTNQSSPIEYPLANLSAPFNKQTTSPALPPSQSNLSATAVANVVENSELVSMSTTNNNTVTPLIFTSTNTTSLTPSVAPAINPIALTTPIDQPEWGQKFSEQILLLSRHGSQQAELRLHPEELGSLQIQLKIVDDKAQLSVVTANQQVRQVIESNLTQLRHALSEQGIQLGQTHVGDHHEQNSDQDNPPSTPLSSITNEPDKQASDHSLTQVSHISQAQITTAIDLFA